MPIYEYVCIHCGATFDQIRCYEEADDPITCPNCSHTETKRKLSKCFSHNDSASNSSGSHSCGSCSGGCCSSCH